MSSYQTRKTLRQHLVQKDNVVRQELRKEVEDTSQAMKDYLTDVTASWNHKVKFRRVMKVTPALIEATVIPTGRNRKIFLYVDRGTGKYGPKGASYKIKPKAARLLKFRASYDARTRPPAGPGSVPQFRGGTGKAIGGWVSTKEVTHPGIRPRKFAESFEKNMQPGFRQRVNNAFRRAARRN